MSKKLKENILDLKKHFFWGIVFKKEKLSEFVNLDKRFLLCLKFFYSQLLICMIALIMYDFNTYWNLKLTDPLWSSFFIRYLNSFPIIIFFLLLATALTFLAIIKTESRLIRWLTFFAIFLLSSLINSTGKINHGWHLLIIGLFTVSLLKFEGKNNIHNTVYYLSGIFLILTTYFFAGFFKLRVAVHQLLNKNGGLFYENCMSKLLDYQYQYEEPSSIAKFFHHQNEILGFGIYWIGVLIELVVVFMFFRIKNLQIIGILLTGLHIGIALLLQVEFYYNIMVLIPLLVLNPLKSNSSFYKFLETN